jgi:hypothetical protein
MFRRILGPQKYVIKIAQGKLAYLWSFITCNLCQKGHEMGTTCMLVCIGETISAFKMYVHKSERKILLRKITLKLIDNIKTASFWNRM